MRVAVFGAGGQLGQALARVGARRGVKIVPFDRAAVDITNAGQTRAALLKAQVDTAVNAAAFTAVDKAETEMDQAFAVNRDGAANVAAAAAEADVGLIHVSTDYVFDGTKAGPYVESDPIAPLGVYGCSKAEGEAAARRAHPRVVVLRTAWVFGLEGANFVKTMLRLAAEREVVRVVDDQRGSPTFADDLADAILKIASHPTPGTYHLAGAGAASWFEFAQAIFAGAAALGAKAPRVEPITTAEYPTPAQRPANSVLDCAKAKRTFAVELPPWNDGLSRMLRTHLGSK
jgi:dTDP-4-dehydrorhamnose reductase